MLCLITIKVFEESLFEINKGLIRFYTLSTPLKTKTQSTPAAKKRSADKCIYSD